MNPQNRQKLLMILAAVVAVVWLGDRMVVTPLIQAWKERSAKIVELRRNVSQGSMLLARDQVIRDRWEGMRTNALPNEVSVAQSLVLRALERCSQSSSLGVTSIKAQWKRNADEYMTLECRVDATGNLAAITRFLYEVEKEPLALKVDSLDLSARDNEGQQLSMGVLVSALLLNPVE